MTDRLRLERDGACARLLIDRPEKRNAFDQEMWEALPDLVDAAMADAGVRVLVLASVVPGAFSAGADIAEFATMAGDPAWRERNRAAIRRTQLTLTRAPKPTIALVDGDCVGGGCGLALACDLRLATPRARFGITPAKLGLVYPLHDTKLLVDLVGPAQAKRLLFTGELVNAEEAARIGLVQFLTDDGERAVADLVAEIVAGSAVTQAAAKAMVRSILDGTTDDDAASAAQFDSAFESADFRERAAAFIERRTPQSSAR